jgi:predicted methyltransferase
MVQLRARIAALAGASISRGTEMKRKTSFVVASLSSVLLLGLAVSHAAAHLPKYITAAVADAGRPDADRERDADRKPAETIAFAGLKPDMQIAELIPGGGYFTRIFSKLVGPKGHIYAIAPPRRPTAPADAPDPSAPVAAIAADPNYQNISVQVARVSELTLPAPVDVIWTSQNYHDFHNVPQLDVVAMNKTLFNLLKPGGIYVVLDHAAAAGSGANETSTLHRIDAAKVKEEVLAAGFEFVAQSELLHNPNDMHVVPIFDPTIKGKTDRFILKFRKPAHAKS